MQVETPEDAERRALMRQAACVAATWAAAVSGTGIGGSKPAGSGHCAAAGDGTGGSHAATDGVGGDGGGAVGGVGC